MCIIVLILYLLMGFHMRNLGSAMRLSCNRTISPIRNKFTKYSQDYWTTGTHLIIARSGEGVLEPAEQRYSPYHR